MGSDPFQEYVEKHVEFISGISQLRSSHGLTKLLRRFYHDNMKPEITQALSHQRKELREKIEGMKKEATFAVLGDPNYKCYRSTGHEYDAYGYCKICFNPHPEARIRAENNSPDQYNAALADILELLK